jgi:hypothetical protein
MVSSERRRHPALLERKDGTEHRRAQIGKPRLYLGVRKNGVHNCRNKPGNSDRFAELMRGVTPSSNSRCSLFD